MALRCSAALGKAAVLCTAVLRSALLLASGAMVLAGQSAANASDLPTSGTALAAVRHGRSSTTLMLEHDVPVVLCSASLVGWPFRV